MTWFALIRHGMCDPVGKAIAGRMSGVHLNEVGTRQVTDLREKLSGARLDAIFTSPLERATETALAVAHGRRVEVVTTEELNEIDYGAWTGLPFTELSRMPQWQAYNAWRSRTRVPQGELILEVQARMAALVERIRINHPDGTVALVSHGDPIKSLIAHYLGISLDLTSRFEVDPASVSVLTVDDFGAQVLCVNETNNPAARLPLRPRAEKAVGNI